MKYMIGVDLEGVACTVGRPNQTLTDSADYAFACRQATREANAAARALFDAGAEQVVVWDNHGGSLNLLYDELDSRCDIVVGAGQEHRWPGMDSSFAGVLLIGYHPMDNTLNGVLAHTFSSVSYQYIKVNGREVGEIAIDGAMAGELGVPVILVASDLAGTEEAKDFMPWVETVATKTGLGRNLALSKHPTRVVTEIYDATRRAVSRVDAMKVFEFSSPLTLEVRYKRLEGAEAAVRRHQDWEYVDPYTVKTKLERLSDYF